VEIIKGRRWLLDAFFVQLIITFPIKLPKEEKKEVKQVFEKVEKLGPHIS